MKLGNLKQVKVDPEKADSNFQWMERPDNKRKRRQAKDDIMMFNADVSLMYDVQRKSS